MSRTLEARPGERTLVFRRRFSSLLLTVEFAAASPSGGPVSGVVERVGSRWILGRTHSAMPLAAHNRVRKGLWDTLFHVYVTPGAPVRITVARPALCRSGVIIVQAILVVVAAAVTLLATVTN